MIVMPFLSLDTVPTVSDMLGTRMSSDLLAQVSREWGDGSTQFGLPGDLFADNHRMFLQGISMAQNVANVIERAIKVFDVRDKIRPINDDQGLSCIPVCMWAPIMTMPTMRRLATEGSLHGFGLDLAKLPTHDVVGRMLCNGTVVLTPGTEKSLRYVWRSDDPRYTLDELDAIRETRGYIDMFMEEQMRLPVGERIDPTNYPNVMPHM